MRAILVIKHGALGDVVLATGPFAAIRAAHPDSHITLLTTKPFANLLGKSPYFDEIWVDEKPKAWHVLGIKALKERLRGRLFARVYDLQTSQRSSSYYHLFQKPKPEWSGVVKEGSHPQLNPNRNAMHTIERHKEQLEIAGITDVPRPDVSWLVAEQKQFVKVPKKGEGKYALLVPGGSAHRPEKRWPSEKYAELANWMVEQGIRPALIGAGSEEEILNTIATFCPQAINLCNQTGFGDIAELARHAMFAVGNDTGPMHIIAAAHCPTLTLFSGASSPEKSAPRGVLTDILQQTDLVDLSLDAVKSSADILLQHTMQISS